MKRVTWAAWPMPSLSLRLAGEVLRAALDQAADLGQPDLALDGEQELARAGRVEAVGADVVVQRPVLRLLLGGLMNALAHETRFGLVEQRRRGDLARRAGPAHRPCSAAAASFGLRPVGSPKWLDSLEATNSVAHG